MLEKSVEVASNLQGREVEGRPFYNNYYTSPSVTLHVP